MALSKRAEDFLEQVRSSQHVKQPSPEEVTALFQEHKLPKIEAFIDCVVTAGGLDFTEPFESIYFYSLPEVLFEPGDRMCHFSYRDGAWWFSALASKYPGTCFMNESGSLHFEREPKDVWASSLEKIIEQSALMASLNTAEKVSDVATLVRGDSLRDIVERAGAKVDSAATDQYFAYCVHQDGILVLLHTYKFDPKKGKCAIRAFLTSENAVKNFRARLGSAAVRFDILK